MIDQAGFVATPYVFLSHSAKDKAFARYLDAALAAHGVETFLDERDIRIGESIPRRVYESIDRATHLICILSPHSVSSRWVQDELDASTMRAHSGLLHVLPVLVAMSFRGRETARRCLSAECDARKIPRRVSGVILAMYALPNP